MSAGVLVSLEEYLSTSYEPDREYIGGVLLERSVGEYYHSLVQGLIVAYFDRLRVRYGPLWRAFPEQRTRTRRGDDDQRRYRVPDVLVLAAGHKRTPVLIEPPLIAIEILSPDDDLEKTATKCAEYVQLGTPHVWIVDPYQRRVYTVGQSGLQEAPEKDLTFTLQGQEYMLSFTALFAEMDQD
jgi:Uma2 family endonuclease